MMYTQSCASAGETRGQASLPLAPLNTLLHAACCAVLLWAAGCGERSERTWFDRGQNAAESRWNQVRGDVRLSMAREELERGRIEAAAEQLAVLEADEGDPAGLELLRAEIALARGEVGVAERLLREILVEEASNAEAQYLLGAVCEQSDRLSEATAAYRRASALDATKGEYALAAAECLLSMGEGEAASAWLRERGVENPGLSSEAAYQLLTGEAYGAMERWEEAASAYQRAIQGGAEDSQTLSRSMDAQMARGDYGGALEVIEVLEARLEDPPAWLTMARARCFLETGRAGRARRVLAVLVRDLDDARAWLMLGEASAKSGDIGGAMGNVKRAIRIDPDSATAHQVLAGLALRAGDAALAIRAAERARQLDPSDALNLTILGEAWERRGDMKRAVRLHGAALELDAKEASIGLAVR